MTSNEARDILDRNHDAIKANCEDYFARRIDFDTFRSRQRQYHDAIDRAGQSDAFLRRWRNEAYA